MLPIKLNIPKPIKAEKNPIVRSCFMLITSRWFEHVRINPAIFLISVTTKIIFLKPGVHSTKQEMETFINPQNLFIAVILL